MRSALRLTLLFWACILAHPQSSAPSDGVQYVGGKVTPPRLIHKVEPEYSPLARADQVQGIVVLQIVVSQDGKATDIVVLSPLGYGLDENAVEAVSKWRFKPGMKEGKPVKVLAQVESTFRFPQIWFDEKAEQQRKRYNLAVSAITKPDAAPPAVESALKTMQDLANQKYPAAMFNMGMWQILGTYHLNDPAGGLLLVQKAADRNYGPALYEIGTRRITGQGIAQDVNKGLDEIRDAAMLGSERAQFNLGARYELGDGVPIDLDRSKRYFRLCAARQVALCQYRLGKLLLTEPSRSDRDYSQGVAWLELAAAKGVQQAEDLRAKETLTSEQSTWIEKLKADLSRKQ